jgi:hypothetical protein
MLGRQDFRRENNKFPPGVLIGFPIRNSGQRLKLISGAPAETWAAAQPGGKEDSEETKCKC